MPPLTEMTIRNAKPRAKTYRIADERGMYLEISPTGGKYWRWKYRFEGKEKRLALGVYPDIGLRAARDRRDDARRLLANGIDPGAQRRADRMARIEAAANNFEAVAREWHNRFRPGWTESNAKRVLTRLERDVFPWIGARPIGQITPPELLSVIRRIERRTLDTAHRALQSCGQIFRYAIATGRADRDIAADLRGALPPVRKRHFAAITDPTGVGALLRSIDGFTGTFVVASVLRLAPLVFLRPGELRRAEWREFDLENAVWSVPGPRMKMKTPHLVPLSTQALAVLRDLHPLTGRGQFVFPGARSDGKPLSDGAINAALRRMGYANDEMTGHGFRAMARTLLDEVLGVRPDVIEQQLAHAVRDPNGRAYNRTAHLAERKKMMQSWADYLDRLRAGADVVSLHRAG